MTVVAGCAGATPPLVAGRVFFCWGCLRKCDLAHTVVGDPEGRLMASLSVLEALKSLLALGMPDEALVVPARWYVDAVGLAHSMSSHAESVHVETGLLAEWVRLDHCGQAGCVSPRAVAGDVGGALGAFGQTVFAALSACDGLPAMVKERPCAAVRQIEVARRSLAKFDAVDADFAVDVDMMRRWALAHLPDLDRLERRARKLLTGAANQRVVALACARAVAAGPDGPVGDLAVLVTGDRQGKRHSPPPVDSDVLAGQAFLPEKVPQVLEALPRSVPSLLAQVAPLPWPADVLERLSAVPGSSVGVVLDGLTDVWRDAVRVRCESLDGDIDAAAGDLLADEEMFLVVYARTGVILASDVAAAFPPPAGAVPPGLGSGFQVVLVPAAVCKWLVANASGRAVRACAGDVERIAMTLTLLSDGGVFSEIEAAWAAADALQ